MFHRMPTSILLHCIAGVAACALLAQTALGDRFSLKSGGQVEGQWLNRGESLLSPYRVHTSDGLTLSLACADVQEVVTQRADEVAYEQLAPKVADNVEQQWKLAEWCRKRHLPDQRQVHLQRILALDPDHLPTRRALGYAQVSGRWLTREEWRQNQGFEYHDGRWRLPQEIELREELQAKKLAEKQWEARLLDLREKLLTEDAVQARDAILAIDDPHAVAALADLLHQDALRATKMIYIAALTKIGNPPAAKALLISSIGDADEEIRYACLDAIEQLDPPGVVPLYIKALGSDNNFFVNRAAFALGRFGDESVVGPLINALVTTHTFTLQSRPQASPDTITTSFTNDQRAAAANAPPLVPRTGSTFSMGEGKKTITRHIPNEEVLTALVRITGAPNYGYNPQAWRAWQESQLQSTTINARGQ